MVSLIVAMDAKPTRKASKRIAERVEANKCLCCDAQPLMRGLCARHYFRWRRNSAALSSNAKRVEYECELIRRGGLLAPQAVRKYKPKKENECDMLDEVASEMNN